MPVKSSVGSVGKPQATTRLPRPGPEATQQQEAPEEGAVSGKSRAALFDEAPVEKGFDFPVGQYFGVITECNFLKEGEKESVQFKVEVEEGEQAGKEVSMFYNFFNEKGEQQRGMGFFKKDIVTLGEEVTEFTGAYAECDADNGDFTPFEDRLRLLADERKRVVIDVKKGQKGYTNVYLQGLQQ